MSTAYTEHHMLAAMRSEREASPDPEGIAMMIAASEALLAREPERLGSARSAMHLIRIRLVMDGAADTSVTALNRYIAQLDAHLRRGRHATMHLVSDHIE